MAKKSRTPAPPRRVQAPKRRDVAPTGTASNRQQRLLLYTAGAAGFLGIGVVALFLALHGGNGSGGGSSSLGPTMAKAGFTLKTYPSLGRKHTGNLNAKIKYNSFPPTSGEHYFQPAVWDMYDSPISQVQGVHNLEHGGILIQYGSGISRSTIDQIAAFYRSDPNAMLVAPLPKLGNKIALTAWTHLATGTRFDEKAFEAFRDAYRYKGPERFPPNALQPGM
jgi:hypothetical protein